jgi:hypothetical protein
MFRILLDHNYTLVSNSREKKSPFLKQIENEQYRADLIESISGYSIVLITARPQKYKEATLISLRQKLDWAPEEAFFNDLGMPPPAIKKSILERFLISRGDSYFGIESNPRTRSMYAKLGIESCNYETFIASPSKWLPPLLVQ